VVIALGFPFEARNGYKHTAKGRNTEGKKTLSIVLAVDV
jgi:hypothetical protein